MRETRVEMQSEQSRVPVEIEQRLAQGVAVVSDGAEDEAGAAEYQERYAGGVVDQRAQDGACQTHEEGGYGAGGDGADHAGRRGGVGQSAMISGERERSTCSIYTRKQE